MPNASHSFQIGCGYLGRAAGVMHEFSKPDLRQIDRIWSLAGTGTDSLLGEDVARTGPPRIADTVAQLHRPPHDPPAIGKVDSWHNIAPATSPLPAGGSGLRYLILIVVFFSSTSNGPASNFGTMVNLPFRLLGTRHVCEHVLPHPYSNVPTCTRLPAALNTSTCGVGFFPLDPLT